MYLFFSPFSRGGRPFQGESPSRCLPEKGTRLLVSYAARRRAVKGFCCAPPFSPSSIVFKEFCQNPWRRTCLRRWRPSRRDKTEEQCEKKGLSEVMAAAAAVVDERRDDDVFPASFPSARIFVLSTGSRLSCQQVLYTRPSRTIDTPPCDCYCFFFYFLSISPFSRRIKCARD